MARKTRSHKKRATTRRKGGNIYASTMRAQRTMEHIVRDVHSVIATLAELSTELQQSIQPGHPNGERFAMAQAEHRWARQQEHDPGHRNREHQHQHAPGAHPVNVWNHPADQAYPWQFEGRDYMRAGQYIYEVPPAGAEFAEEYVGMYVPAEHRINRNVPEPDWPNQ